MVMIPLGNYSISASTSNTLINNFGSYFMVYGSFFGILLFGMGMACLNIRYGSNPEIWDRTNQSFSLSKKRIRARKIVKILLKITCYLILLGGFYFSLVLLFGMYLQDIISVILGIFLPMWSIFLSLIVLSTTLLLLKLKDKRKKPKRYHALGIMGSFLSMILLLPMILAPYSIARSEVNFSSAFGNDWRNKITPVARSYFLQTPFSIQGYFLGMAPKECIIKENVLFYTNETEGIELYFDAYMPINKGIGMPGQNSTLIRIHGGAWVLGDKGGMNMMQVNNYFAAQGYVVFDIQYGLKDIGLPSFLYPENVVGDFNLDDMMRHIGNFTRYISSHASEYGANLDSVFISGGSAGGQLACSTAFGIHSGNYTGIFGNNLTIKGVIPLYPAIERTVVKGDINFINPQNLINETSPPCLIFQGTQDNLVHPSKSQLIKDAYTRHGNDKCAIIWADLGGHASDMYFPGLYNQMFLYYMERFMFLCVNDFM